MVNNERFYENANNLADIPSKIGQNRIIGEKLGRFNQSQQLESRIQACEQLQNFCEHEQESQILTFASTIQ